MWHISTHHFRRAAAGDGVRAAAPREGCLLLLAPLGLLLLLGGWLLGTAPAAFEAFIFVAAALLLMLILAVATVAAALMLFGFGPLPLLLPLLPP